MNERNRPTPENRRYPPFYEKAIPIALVLIALVILVLLVAILAVILGVFPGAR